MNHVYSFPMYVNANKQALNDILIWDDKPIDDIQSVYSWA